MTTADKTHEGLRQNVKKNTKSEVGLEFRLLSRLPLLGHPRKLHVTSHLPSGASHVARARAWWNELSRGVRLDGKRC